MKSILFKGHPDKEQRLKELSSYKNAFDDLKEILQREYKKKPVRDYSDPNWSYRQIAVNEHNAVLDSIIALLTLEDE